MVLFRHFAKAVTLGGLAFLLLPLPCPFPALASRLDAQGISGRLRRPPPGDTSSPPPAAAQTAVPVPAPVPAAAQIVAPATAPAAPGPAAGLLPPSMLEQPAQPATVQFSAQSLSIHANNSSLREILHQISEQTGMEVQGLGSDERVFGTFGPGAPQDIVNDLLNGTPYDVLTVGALANGAPRELILSPSSHATASAAAPPPPSNNDSDDAPPDNDVQSGPVVTPPTPPSPPAGPTVQSPQALFQQLQQMHEQQQQPQQQQQQQQQQQSQQPPPQQ